MWKEFKFESNYEINELGCIRNNKTFKELTPFITTNGYLRVRIKGKGYQVHKLIAEHFIDNPNNYVELNHIDGNKLNNSIDNLEWSTRSLNMLHAYRTELSNSAKCANLGEKHGKSKLTNENVKDIWYRLLDGEKAVDIAKLYNVSKATIGNIKLKKNWKELTDTFN